MRRRSGIHIIGAGLAGLAAAVTLADSQRQITLYEAARQAGGRCRSYFDTALDMVIDNGNHLLLSGNHEARDYLKKIDGEDRLTITPEADFPFIDLATGERWNLRPNGGCLPWWVLAPSRRVPGTKFADYLALGKLLLETKDRPIGEVLSAKGPLYARLWRPFLLATLNTDPQEGSTALARQVILQTLAKGGNACRPVIASPSLSAAFIEPAIAYLQKRGVDVCLDYRLRQIGFTNSRATSLDFGDVQISLPAGDHLILAVPAPVAMDLLPGLIAPLTHRAIINAHFKIAPSPRLPAITGVVNGTVEWLFSFKDRLSITISGADRLLEVPREELVQRIWQDVAKIAQISGGLPAWQIIKEKRATFAATVAENSRRPKPDTAFENLWLAGDWTATGLPATIEGAILSGNRAAGAIPHLP
jgi:squalene-associated FAD-dependent desaturase